MSLLREGDILFVKLARRINGKLVEEQLQVEAEDVIYLSTPHLLRHFVEQIDRAQARLDAAEEYGTTRESEDV